MEKRFSFILLGFLVFCFGILLYSCASSSWNRAVKRNTILDYEYYIEKYPDGEHVLECRKRLDELYKIPRKVAEKEVNLYLRCMSSEERYLRKIEKHFKDMIEQKHSDTNNAISSINNEVYSGKRKCYKEERVCSEWITEKGSFLTANKQKCNKWAVNKQTDYDCIGYWENKEKEYQPQIAQLRNDLNESLNKLNIDKNNAITEQNNKSIELCKTNLKSDHYDDYPPEIKNLFPNKSNLNSY